MAIQDSFKDVLLNHIFRTTAYPQPTSLDIALFANSVELAGTGYARIAVGTTDADWNVPAAGTGTRRQVTNAAAIDFGTAGSDWAPAASEVDEVRVYEGATLRFTCTQDAAGAPFSIVIQSGNPVQIPAGDLVLFFEDGSA